MDAIARFFTKAGMLIRRENFNSELEEEMSFHREQKEKELREAGVAPAYARPRTVCDSCTQTIRSSPPVRLPTEDGFA